MTQIMDQSHLLKTLELDSFAIELQKNENNKNKNILAEIDLIVQEINHPFLPL